MKTKTYILQNRDPGVTKWSEKFRSENFDDVRTLHAAAEILKRHGKEVSGELRIVEITEKVLIASK